MVRRVGIAGQALGVSRRAGDYLPVLYQRVQELAYATARMPDQAAREMVLAVQFDHRRQVDPYGHPWKPVLEHRAMEREVDSDTYRPFDVHRHVRDTWQPAVEGSTAIIASDHLAAAPLQKAYKRRPQRLMHPLPGQGLGTWERRIQRMLKRLIYGAMMGTEKREERKLSSAIRRAARHDRRNADRVKLGLKPLRQRVTRRDRRRIDELVVRALRGGSRG